MFPTSTAVGLVGGHARCRGHFDLVGHDKAFFAVELVLLGVAETEKPLRIADLSRLFS